MNAEDFANIVRLVRRAPLANMDEAEHVANLLQRFGEHADNILSEGQAQRDPAEVLDLSPGGTS